MPLAWKSWFSNGWYAVSATTARDAVTGFTTVGSASQNLNEHKVVTNLQLGAIVVSKVTARIQTDGSATVKAVIYADAAGSPGAKIAEGAEVILLVSTDAWVDLPFSSWPSLSAATYWVGYLAKSGPPDGIFAKTAFDSGSSKYNVDTYSDGASDPFGASFGFGGQLAVNVTSYASVPLEALGGVSAASAEPLESGQALQVAGSSDPLEANRKLAATVSSPYEKLLPVSQSGNSDSGVMFNSPIEAPAGIAATKSEPYEALKALAVAGQTTAEALKALAVVGNSDPVEANKGISATLVAAYEALKALAIVGSSDPLEATKALTVGNSDPLEATKALAVVGSADPLEANKGISATLAAAYEALKALVATVGDPLEALKALAVVGSADPLEANKGISATLAAAYEALVALAVSRQTTAEALKALAVAGSSDPLEANKGISATLAAAYEALVALAVSRQTTAEALKALAIAGSSDPLEALKALAIAGSSDPLEALQGLRQIDSPISEDDHLGSGGGSTGFGFNAANEKLGESFSEAAASQLSYVDLPIFKDGSPSDNLIAAIYANVGGVPGGAVLAQSSAVDGSTLPTSASAASTSPKRFVFTGPVAIAAATTYWIVLSRSGALDASNNYEWVTRTGGGLLGARFGSGSWSSGNPTFKYRLGLLAGASVYEVLQGIAATRQDAFETLKALAAIASDQLEANKGLAVVGTDPLEASQSIGRTATLPDEALQALAASAAAPYETSGVVFVSVSNTAVLPIETQQAIVAAKTTPAEAKQLVAAVSASPAESMRSLAAALAAVYEAQQGIHASAAAAPLETLQAVAARLSDAIETLRALAVAAASSPAESTSSVRTSAEISTEALQAIAASQAMPYEAQASVVIIQTATLPLETLQRIQASGMTFVDFPFIAKIAQLILIDLAALALRLSDQRRDELLLEDLEP